MPTCYLKVTYQIGTGAEELLWETSTASTSWETKENTGFQLAGGFGQKITLRFYIRTDNASYPAQMANPSVRGVRYGRRLQIP